MPTKKVAVETITITREEYDALQHAKSGQTHAPGFHPLNVAEYGDATYDAAIGLRVLPSGSWIQYNVKHSGWVQEVANFIPQRNKKPAAGNGGYRQRRMEIMRYRQSKDYVADNRWLDSQTPAAAMADPKNVWNG